MGGRGNTVADEENPFDMDMSELQKAIPVAPRATKQRTLEVKCPMCETIGFVAPQHQGKDVKCSNTACKHPYFTVPIPKKESADDGLKKKKGMSIGQVLGLVAAGLALVGTAVWWFVIRIEPVDPARLPTIVEQPTPSGGTTVDSPPPPPPKPTRMARSEIQKGAISELVRIAGTNDPNQGLAIRYLAESYAIAGQPQQSLAELTKLMNRPNDASYLQIEPLVRLYLHSRKAGVAEARKHLDQALKAAENLPQSGRGPLDAVNALAAALVLDDRQPEAVRLVGAGADGNRADYSMLWTAALYGNAFDFQRLSEIPAWLAAPHPQHASVTWVLSAWGERDKALAWARTADSDEGVDASLAVWAAHLGLSVKSTAEGVGILEAALQDAKPAGQSRAWSNYAYQRAAAGDAAAAKELMTRADAAFNSLPTPTPISMPSIKEIHDNSDLPRAGLPAAGPQRSAALAAANLAVLHLQLGDKAPVEDLLSRALDYAEAIAPAPPAVAVLKARAENARTMEYELDTLLNLKGNKQRSFQALNRFRSSLTTLEKVAAKRDQFERELIRDIAYRGEPALAWAVIQKRDRIEPAERRSMLTKTPLAFYIAFTAVAIGDNATANAIGATKPTEKDKIDEVINAIVFHMKTGNFTSAINELKTIYRAGTYDRDRVDLAVLKRVSQYQTLTRAPQKVFDLIRELPDPQVQEAAMTLLSARAVVDDQGPELYKLTSPDRMQRSLTVPLRVALARGYIAGAAAAPTPPAPKKDAPK